jgi:hypothetical protein
LYFGIGPPIVHCVGAVLDASGIGSEVWQGQLLLVVEHALSPPTVTLPMSPVQTPVAVAHLGHPLVPFVYPHEGDWCAPMPFEIYVVAAGDVWVIRLHPWSHPLVMYPRPLPRVFLSMMPPYTCPWRPSTSTYSPLPVSTIIGRRCGCTLIMPPVGTQDMRIRVCYDPCTTPLTPSIWLSCTTGGEGAALPLFGRGTPEF